MRVWKNPRYNIENDIHFYRLTSALIPVTTHPDVWLGI
ncbi:MAG: hypothetical protein ACLRPW_03880 [Intestinibacter sp.]